MDEPPEDESGSWVTALAVIEGVAKEVIDGGIRIFVLRGGVAGTLETTTAKVRIGDRIVNAAELEASPSFAALEPGYTPGQKAMLKIVQHGERHAMVQEPVYCAECQSTDHQYPDCPKPDLVPAQVQMLDLQVINASDVRAGLPVVFYEVEHDRWSEGVAGDLKPGTMAFERRVPSGPAIKVEPGPRIPDDQPEVSAADQSYPDGLPASGPRFADGGLVFGPGISGGRDLPRDQVPRRPRPDGLGRFAGRAAAQAKEAAAVPPRGPLEPGDKVVIHRRSGVLTVTTVDASEGVFTDTKGRSWATNIANDPSFRARWSQYVEVVEAAPVIEPEVGSHHRYGTERLIYSGNSAYVVWDSDDVDRIGYTYSFPKDGVEPE